MEKFRKIVGYRTIKTALGAALAIFISQLLGLSYAVNSGIIVILSVQNTKKKSREVAKQRLIATILALAIGVVVFSVIGFNAPAFAVYLLLFIPLATRFGFHDAIVPCSVLVSHLLAIESVAPVWLLNEFMQMVIGAGIGLLMNLHIPSSEGKLKEDSILIEECLKSVLMDMAECFERPLDLTQDENISRKLEAALALGMERSLIEAANHSEGDVPYFVRYMEMRSQQYEILRFMNRYIQKIRFSYVMSEMAADLTRYVAWQIRASDPKDAVLKELEVRKEIYQTLELPKTREEFEDRAALHEYVNDLEHFLGIERDFVNSLTAAEKHKYDNE